jgi:phosphoglycerate kinase
MDLKTIKEADVKNKKVLMRVDYNVPLDNGKVADDTRIKASLETIEYLIENDAKIILMSHLGRPKGNKDDKLSLKPVAEKLSKILKKDVDFADDCIGDLVKEKIDKMNKGDILMLENTRFHAEEKENDKEFSKKLAEHADIYVSDAFGTAHRAHASTEGVSKHLPSYAGFLIEKEIEALSPLLKDPDHPFLIIMGGAKIDTKLGVIKEYIGKADKILLGGGLANTFVYARGFDVGESLCEKDKIEEAREMMLTAENQGTEIIMPDDFVVADEVSEGAMAADIETGSIGGNMHMLDIGSNALENYIEILKEAKTIIWNGPVGLYEKKPFDRGTKEIAKALTKVDAKTYIGGGDTLDALKRFDINQNKFTHVSTGGGAMLEFLEGKELPGIKILKK